MDAAQNIAPVLLSDTSVEEEDRVSGFWTKLGELSGADTFSEWTCLAETTLVQVTGFSEDERAFSLMKLLK